VTITAQQRDSHCIGVDPYHLTARAEAGYCPQVILSGRRINDGMGGSIAQRLVKLLIAAERRSRAPGSASPLRRMCPICATAASSTFVAELREFGIEALVADPLADPVEAKREHGVDLVLPEQLTGLDGLNLAAPHRVLGAAGWNNLFAMLS
jgi:UDP-N-acetyl-D-galactosamine dehydrogenase